MIHIAFSLWLALSGTMNAPTDNPFEFFAAWFAEAGAHKAIAEANAVCLATATPEGQPSARMVLMKDWDERGFVFFTNLESRKGGELAANPQVAMCFYWEPLSKQVRIEGRVEPVSAAEADAYFNSRPLKSRIGAWASKQSRPMESKNALLAEVAKQAARFVTEDVPRPPFWSGFRLVPERMEFWQKGEFRIHDRHCFTREGEAWQHVLLYP